MVKTGWTVLKIGIHSAFGPNSPMEFGTLDFKNLGWPSAQYCLLDFRILCLSWLATGLGVIVINTNLKSNPRYFARKLSPLSTFLNT